MARSLVRGRQDGCGDVVVRCPVRRGCGTGTRRHDIHARAEEIRLLDGLNRLDRLKLLSRLKRDDGFDLLSSLEGDDGPLWLWSGSGES